MNEETKNSQTIPVRPMRDDEKRAARVLAGRAFPPLGNLFFSPPPNTLVAEQNGQVVGAVVPKAFVLPDGHRGGVILWLMTDPKARGLGVGQRLVEEALRFFEERSCREVFACVGGFNTSSSNIFAAHGFTVLSPGEQFRRYGFFGMLALWLRTYRFGGDDLGHFLWARPGTTRPDGSPLQWWGGALTSALIFLLAGWRGGWIGEADLATVLSGVAAVLALLGLREAAMKLTARLLGLSVRYRAWESAFVVSFGAALILGVFFPVLGSVYPRDSTTRYRDLIPKLGPMAFAGASAVLILTGAVWAVWHLGVIPAGAIGASLRAVYKAGLSLAVVEVLLPFPPFVSFGGRRVWDWNRPVWGVLAIAAVGLLLVGG
jgi:GNAT superfamily N-acetyltransferase